MRSTPSLRQRLLTACLLPLLAAPALALERQDFDYETTRNLYNICSVPSGDAHAMTAALACRAFIEATMQYHDAVSAHEALEPLVCHPPKATLADAQAAFLDWAGKHADEGSLMDEVPVKGVVRALAERYPCR
ncbi:hypothetical protein MARPU_12565 [Marichromatium purpuratum 984]|uniref:Rap1a immunity protein domain-containing protein n=1 Tax=Marichromatium purpuratum 984 TaxID=765910 RepID=W0E678_MARPU|nr:Rap1a/Tai family immunity protein [Marichromatium purpuratum]AHF04581.1 hypothetical protein MARPU_12565 [Marichromatium purpuratum 984]